MGRQFLRNNIRRVFSGLGVSIVFGLWANGLAYGAELRIALQDADTGNPLEDAVVEVILPVEMHPIHLTTVNASVDQQDKEFVANVTVITRGSRANFPNSDNILHHVYSFSPTKVFELPLYGNGQNIDYYQLFDQAGIVELGCNIHDWMLGYIYVAETDLAAKTDASGQAVIANIPTGEYMIRIWHPRVDANAADISQQITFTSSEPARLQRALTLQRDSRLRRAPNASRSRYR